MMKKAMMVAMAVLPLTGIAQDPYDAMDEPAYFHDPLDFDVAFDPEEYRAIFQTHCVLRLPNWAQWEIVEWCIGQELEAMAMIHSLPKGFDEQVMVLNLVNRCTKHGARVMAGWALISYCVRLYFEGEENQGADGQSLSEIEIESNRR